MLKELDVAYRKKIAEKDKHNGIPIEEVKLRFNDLAGLGQTKYELIDEEGDQRLRISSIKRELMELWRNHKYEGSGFRKGELTGPSLDYSDEANGMVFVVDSYKGLDEMSVVELGKEIEYALERTNLEDKQLSSEATEKLYNFRLKEGEMDKLAENTPERKLKKLEE